MEGPLFRQVRPKCDLVAQVRVSRSGLVWRCAGVSSGNLGALVWPFLGCLCGLHELTSP